MSEHYAKYEADNQDIITKDGHVMFPADIARDLNRKSYLEAQNKALTDDVERLSGLLNKVVIQVSPEPIGKMSGMSSQKKRMAWYGEMRALRLEIEQALNQKETKV